MGWSATLRSNKDISHEEVEAIVSHLPSRLKLGGIIEPTFNDWGWNAAADIHKPNGHILNINGCYSISGHMAEPIADYFQKQLEIRGHVIDIEWSW